MTSLVLSTSMSTTTSTGTSTSTRRSTKKSLVGSSRRDAGFADALPYFMARA
ncbi:MAG: hypothetical protein HYU36_17345 [Planctomycetes bacterium]|nr:hypothetical protein [Planctomycetota bacterium]